MERRDFVRNVTGAAAWTALSASRVIGANDRVVVGIIGCGGRGRTVMRETLRAPNTELAVACDVYDANAARAAHDLSGGQAKTVKDFRRLLETREVDAVQISTPDHWHAIPTVLALEAGKHVYVEKPFALTIREGRAMVEAARRTGRILYPGTQHRSAPHVAEAARMVQSGEIGDVSLVRVWNSGNIAPDVMKKQPDSDPPAGLDWDFYLGPSPTASFNRRRFLTTYRLFYDYAGGYITDYGNHRVDSVHQIMNASSPHTISAVGRRLCPENAGDIFDLHVVTYQYPNFVMEYVANWVNTNGIGGRSPGMSYYGMRGAYNRPHGFAFYGTKAALYVDRIGYETFPELEPGPPYETPAAGETNLKYRAERKAFQGADATSLHAQSFISQVRIGHKSAIDEMVGHTATAACHLGTIAAKTGRTLHWNAAREDFENDPEASKLLTRSLRKPYDLIQL
ncbi:MAG TPA: Gfo/Idh/MocA family oxidoreductase [Bryobacteraceae bacterium]|jgi:predicted dehydrogenase|nr:Gfo/Idh/MocA family oxidoreductase [Bryobacteraceae bacterium]